MCTSKLGSKLRFGRLREYGYKVLGRIKRIDQPIELFLSSKNLMDRAERALSSSPLETAVFFFGMVKGKKLLATNILIPSSEYYEKRTFGHVHVSPHFITHEFPKFERRGKTLLATMHSHPMDTLSFGDVRTHMSVVKYYPYQLSAVYNNGRIFFYRFENGMKVTPHRVLDLTRFDRQTRLFGEEGQMLISASTIALIGVGGGNTKIAFDLASLGIGKLILVDPDNWEEHNRNRIFIPPEFIGKSKAESVQELIERYYQDLEVEAYVKKAEDIADRIYAKSDIIIVGPDRKMTRVFGNRLALRLEKPAVFPGAGIDSKDSKLSLMGGSVQVVVPDSPCYECINTVAQLDVLRETLEPVTKKRLSEKYGLGDLLEIPTAPAIAPLNNVIGGLALWEIVKLITGIEPVTHLQVYDGLKSELKAVQITKNPTCPACGQESSSKKIDETLLTKDPDELLSALEKM